MKRKVFVILSVFAVLLFITALVTSYADSARVRNAVDPKHTIKTVSNDGSKVTYWGLGYKVIRYPSVSPNEPYKNNRGVKYGSWFMEYDLPDNQQKDDYSESSVKEVFDIKVSYAGWSDDSNIFFGALNREKMAFSNFLHLPIFKFDTLSELEVFKNGVSQTLTIDSGYDKIASFNENTAGYDDKFFEENTLLLVYVSSSSGSYRYNIESVNIYSNTLCVHAVRTNNPDTVTMDMAGWFLTAAIPDSIVKNCTAFDADLNNFQD